MGIIHLEYVYRGTFCSNSRTNCLEKHEKINSRRCVHRFCTQNPCARKNDTRKRKIVYVHTIKSCIRVNQRPADTKIRVFFFFISSEMMSESFLLRKKNGVSLFICSKNFLICYTLLLFNSRQ